MWESPSSPFSVRTDKAERDTATHQQKPDRENFLSCGWLLRQALLKILRLSPEWRGKLIFLFREKTVVLKVSFFHSQ